MSEIETEALVIITVLIIPSLVVIVLVYQDYLKRKAIEERNNVLWYYRIDEIVALLTEISTTLNNQSKP
jgi:hypothetical protein